MSESTVEQPTETATVLAGLGLGPAEDETTEETAEEVVDEPADEEVIVPEGADNPDAVKRAIEAERKAAKEAKARAKELERQLHERTEAEKPIEQRIRESQEEAEAAKLRALRYEVAAEAGLDLRLATRLSGTTKEELAADAKTVSELFGSAPAVAPEGGVRKPAPPKPENAEQAHNQTLAALIAQKRGATSVGDIFAGLEPAED